MKRIFFILILCGFGLFQLSACSDTSGRKTKKATVAAEIVPSSVSPVPAQLISSEQEDPIDSSVTQVFKQPSPASKIDQTSPKVTKKVEETSSKTVPAKSKITAEATVAPDVEKQVVEEKTPVETAATIVSGPTKQTTPSPTIADQAPMPNPDHSAWDALLRKYVSESGKVNYEGFKSEKKKLQAYLDDLAAKPVQASWSRAEKMAYWINVYNAFTIKLIVDNFPLKSITDLHGGKAWDVKWIRLGDNTYSLNQVENEILRPQFKDARIHFAVNCAAQSCPPLLNRAWTAENLELKLEQQTRSFINNPQYNSLSARKVEVSKIFDWYATDFGDLTDFLNKYAKTDIDDQAEVIYREYDWSLNN